MRFLVDAQLPERLPRQLSAARDDAIHSSALPSGNRSTDAEIPRRLLIVATGNISNDALLRLFDQHLDAVFDALGEGGFVESDADRLIVHTDR